jgi:inner membrane protein
MFIAHLPAGYVMARLLARRARLRGRAGVRFLWAGAIGAIAPDFDLAYFYLVDGRQHNHHSYVTHYPVIWIAAMLVCACWWRADRTRRGPRWPACSRWADLRTWCSTASSATSHG